MYKENDNLDYAAIEQYRKMSKDERAALIEKKETAVKKVMLRTRESNEFIEFLKIVEDRAEREGLVFFLDCEYGNDGEVDGVHVSNLCGWFIPEDRADEFKEVWEKGEEDDEWADFFGFVTWKNEKGLKLFFEV